MIFIENTGTSLSLKQKCCIASVEFVFIGQIPPSKSKLEYMFSGFCAVSGSPVRPSDYNRYGLKLETVYGGEEKYRFGFVNLLLALCMRHSRLYQGGHKIYCY